MIGKKYEGCQSIIASLLETVRQPTEKYWKQCGTLECRMVLIETQILKKPLSCERAVVALLVTGVKNVGHNHHSAGRAFLALEDFTVKSGDISGCETYYDL